MSEERVKKVTAIVARQGRAGIELLVFDHPLEDSGIMIQLPAGTVEPDELPGEAVIRELLEETGVHGQLVALAGVRDEEWEGEERRRWVYLLRTSEELSDEWPSTCDCGVPTRCYWVSFEQAEIVEPQQPWLAMARSWIRASS
ncbi:MAG: NUDIX domain-containing protein [Dehalococcoidia bacterium]|nr:NUDIX domain-containing protein [Dehalococcoidia bacterium]